MYDQHILQHKITVQHNTKLQHTATDLTTVAFTYTQIWSDFQLTLRKSNVKTDTEHIRIHSNQEKIH